MYAGPCLGTGVVRPRGGDFADPAREPRPGFRARLPRRAPGPARDARPGSERHGGRGTVVHGVRDGAGNAC
ncbi:hypothetical protein EBF04_05180 [Streptomyces sp. I6]|nr:hypothetical protein EBF04_05180 [Streptomyces sp. I6]